MPNSRCGCLVVVTILCGLSGCGLTDEVPTGPKFVVAAKNVVPAIPVVLTDDRPKWERKYFPGTSEPEQHETAITFVPMENLQPSAGALLKQKIAAALNPLTDRPARIDVEIRSFRVVYDDRKRYRDWHEERVADQRKREQEQKDQQPGIQPYCYETLPLATPPPNYEHHLRRKKGQSKDEWEAEQRRKKKKTKSNVDADPSATSAVFGFLIDGLVKRAFKGVKNGVESGVGSTQGAGVRRERVPDDICDGYPSGLTCDIKLVVRVTWADGRIFTARVRDLASGPPPEVGDESINVPPVVESAISKVSERISTETSHWLLTGKLTVVPAAGNQ